MQKQTVLRCYIYLLFALFSESLSPNHIIELKISYYILKFEENCSTDKTKNCWRQNPAK